MMYYYIHNEQKETPTKLIILFRLRGIPWLSGDPKAYSSWLYQVPKGKDWVPPRGVEVRIGYSPEVKLRD